MRKVTGTPPPPPSRKTMAAAVVVVVVVVVQQLLPMRIKSKKRAFNNGGLVVIIAEAVWMHLHSLMVAVVVAIESVMGAVAAPKQSRSDPVARIPLHWI